MSSAPEAEEPVVAVVGSTRLAIQALQSMIALDPSARWRRHGSEFLIAGVSYRVVRNVRDAWGVRFADVAVLADADIDAIEEARLRVDPAQAGRLFPHTLMPGWFRPTSHAVPPTSGVVAGINVNALWEMGAGERQEVMRKLGAALRPFCPSAADELEGYDGSTAEPPPEKPTLAMTITYSGGRQAGRSAPDKCDLPDGSCRLRRGHAGSCDRTARRFR